MASLDLNVFERADEMYERYGKPLEGEHWGKYVAVSYDGRTLLGTDMHATYREGRKAFGEDMHVFHVGEKYIKLPPIPHDKVKPTDRKANEEALKRSRALYDRYVKHLEAEHWGKFIAVYPDVKTLLGAENEDMDEVSFKALEKLGRGFHLFKVGPRAVGRI